MDFRDRQVVVTGGTGTLGTAVVATLLDAGATCHVPNFDTRELAGFAHAGRPGVSLTTGVDLTDQDEVDTYYGSLPRLWASIHLAGGFAMAPLAEAGSSDFHAQMEMNVLTAYLCCRAAVANMRGEPAGGGRLVNVAARPALEPRQGAGMALYAAAKAAVATLTVALAEEVAPEDIWINAVAPSILDTPQNRAAMPSADFTAWPKVEDVASTIAFLAGPGNRVTRGAVVTVYGRS
jgi:NAD(P)-dependent dehydrogenase (short-subunit alcohol dehydrogenase family)